MLIADATGVEMADIEVVYGDTDQVSQGGITGGSRSVQLAGSRFRSPPALVTGKEDCR